MWGRRSLGIAFVALSMLAPWLHAGLAWAQAPGPATNSPSTRVNITIKARQFHPSPVLVPVGRPVVLIFHNQDAELHAFVPRRFLEGVPVHVDGNGAAQFGDTGLERVLIPSGGREEIHFVPAATGTFEYRCDLPGHQMVGKIVVEHRSADLETAGERQTGVQGTP